MYDIVEVVYMIDGVEYSNLDCELTAEVVGNTLG